MLQLQLYSTVQTSCPDIKIVKQYLCSCSTVQEMILTEEVVEFIVKVTQELQDYLNCLEKVGYVALLSDLLSIIIKS